MAMTYYIIIAFILGAGTAIVRVHLKNKRLNKFFTTAEEVKEEIGLAIKRLEQIKNGAPQKLDISFCAHDYESVEIYQPYRSKEKFEFPGIQNISNGRLNSVVTNQKLFYKGNTSSVEAFSNTGSKTGAYALKPC